MVNQHSVHTLSPVMESCSPYIRSRGRMEKKRFHDQFQSELNLQVKKARLYGYQLHYFTGPAKCHTFAYLQTEHVFPFDLRIPNKNSVSAKYNPYVLFYENICICKQLRLRLACHSMQYLFCSLPICMPIIFFSFVMV